MFSRHFATIRRTLLAPIAPTLFSWQEVESSSGILRLRRILESLDDAKLIEALVAERKGRRDDYPIVPLWHSLFAAFIFNLPGPATLIRELKRNAELRRISRLCILLSRAFKKLTPKNPP